MRLAAAPPESTSGLEAAVGEVLDRRLLSAHARPLAVAFSGGGDSLAMLLAAACWASRAQRRLLILTVDHRLRPASTGWTAACQATAGRLGVPFQALSWDGDKPASGLPAAARAARHRLLAEAARTAGARVILMGHTADDVIEAARMRETGSTTPSAREWGPSPAWPEGRGVFLLRPLLGLRRGEIREWLIARGEAWIDDPANTDMSYARARARRDLTAAPPPPGVSSEGAEACDLALACRETAGGLIVSRRALRLAHPEAARRFAAAACLCAAGTDRPPDRARAQRLAARLRAPGEVSATLAGARIEADQDDVRFARDAGEAARGGLAPLDLAAGEIGVWDGRFEVTATQPSQVRRLAGLASRLSRSDRAMARALPAGLRPALPVNIDGAGDATLATARSLTLARLLAACGAVDREPA